MRNGAARSPEGINEEIMTERKSYQDVATVGELQQILSEVSEEHGEDTEVTVPRTDGFSVPVHPTLIVDWDGVTLELTYSYP